MAASIIDVNGVLTDVASCNAKQIEPLKNFYFPEILTAALWVKVYKVNEFGERWLLRQFSFHLFQSCSDVLKPLLGAISPYAKTSNKKEK